MKMEPSADSTAIIETRVAHDVHRVASAWLVEAALRPTVPRAALAQLRDFLVANLRHHHETEDDDLWPHILSVAPHVEDGLKELSEEHERLDEALDALAAVALAENGTGDEVDAPTRDALHKAADEVRKTVLEHLDHEEPVLFPALREHVSETAWAEFAQRVTTTAPVVGAHLMIGFVEEVATPEETEVVFSGFPEPVRPLLPSMRDQATQDLHVLRGTAA